MSVTTILDTAKQALFAQQRAIQVVGQNIANVNTPGYSRQRPEFLPARPSQSGIMKFGVTVEQVTRAYDRFLTGQVNDTVNNAAGAKTQADLLGQVEALFNDLNLEDAGLAGALERFFQGFQELASNPAGIPERTVVLTQGQTLADTFHTLHTGLDDLRKNADTLLRDEVEQTNRLVQEIAELNGTIQQMETDPTKQANSVRDERDLLLKQLSERVPLTSFEDEAGKMTVLLGGGRPLIEGHHFNTLVAQTDPDDPLRSTIEMQDAQGNLVDVSHSITSGKLASLMEIRDTVLPDLTTDLNRLAAQLSSSVNQIHSSGYGLNGSTGYDFFAPRQVTGQSLAQNTGGGTLQSASVFDPTQLTLDEYRINFVSGGASPTFDIVNTTTGETLETGQTYTSGATIRFDGIAVVLSHSGTAPQQGDSFTFSTTKDAAKNIAVDPGIITNVKNIAAGTTPQPGDNTNALALADLGAAASIDDSTFGEFYNTMVSAIGVESRSQQDLAEHQELLLAEIETQREALSGVSLDEEQIDLIRFQQAYGAAANLIRVADEMTDVVLNMIR